MKFKPKYTFWIGIAILLIMLLTFFIRINVSSGGGTIITQIPLLGVLIFYNPFVLITYIIIALFLIVKGLVKKKIKLV